MSKAGRNATTELANLLYLLSTLVLIAEADCGNTWPHLRAVPVQHSCTHSISLLQFPFSILRKLGEIRNSTMNTHERDEILSRYKWDPQLRDPQR